MSQKNDYWPVIAIYSRADAIKDTFLIDVTEYARQAGFRLPLAITQTVWAQWIEANGDLQEYGQSTEARLWDVLNVLRFTVSKLPTGGSITGIKFRVLFLMNAEGNHYAEVELIAVCHPGDHGKAVL